VFSFLCIFSVSGLLICDPVCTVVVPRPYLFVYYVMGAGEIARPFAKLELFSAAPQATLKLPLCTSNLQPASPNRETPAAPMD